MWPKTERMCVTALTMSPVPASPLVRIIAAPSASPSQRLAEVRAAADERHREGPLVHVVRGVGRRQHLALVDVVDLERLEHLRLDEVADAALGHHRDRDGLLDLADLVRVGHARDAALATDVGRHALERHHGDGAGVLGDARLLGVGDVHDHPALEHLGEAALDPHRPGFGHRGDSSQRLPNRPDRRTVESAAQPLAERRANERCGSRHHGQGSGEEAFLEPRSASSCRAQRLVPGARLVAPPPPGGAEEARPRSVRGPGGAALPPLPELVRGGARQDRRLLLVHQRRLGRRAHGQAPAADVPGRRPPALGDGLDDEGQAQADEHPLPRGGRSRCACTRCCATRASGSRCSRCSRSSATCSASARPTGRTTTARSPSSTARRARS